MIMKRLFRILAAVSLLAAFSCTKEADLAPNEVPEQTTEAKTYTMTVVASKGEADTRALSLEDKTLTASWTKDDEVLVYKGETQLGTLIAQSSGTSTTLSGQITAEGLEDGDKLTLKFLSPDYGSQDGTLEYIAGHCDYATAEVTVTLPSVGNTISVSNADFVSQQAIVKFSLKWNTTGELLTNELTHDGVSLLTIQSGGTVITVTPNPPSSILFVALPAMDKAAIDMTALYGGGEFVYEKKEATFAAGKYYEIGVQMSLIFSIPDEATLRAFLTGEQDMHDGATGRITNDITLHSVSPYIGDTRDIAVVGTKTLDLNGKTLSGKKTSRLFSIPEGAKLTLTGGGVIKEGKVDEEGVPGCGGAIYNKGTLLVGNVTISGSYGHDCGGIYNALGGTLTIDGSTISGNSSGLGGGGVVNYGTATIKNAVIENNKAGTRGGGIWSDNSLTVENTVIRGNMATEEEGGGVHVKNGSATLDGVTLEGNTSPDGGAIRILEGASVTIRGTSVIRSNSATEHGGGGIKNDGTLSIQDDLTITGNTSVGRGAGIFQNSILNMQGAPKIYGNLRDGVNHNLYISTGRVITVDGAFTEGANVHVTLQEGKKEVFTSGYFTTNGYTDPTGIFSLDAATYLSYDGTEVRVSDHQYIVFGKYTYANLRELLDDTGLFDAIDPNLVGLVIILYFGGDSAVDVPVSALSYKYLSTDPNGNTVELSSLLYVPSAALAENGTPLDGITLVNHGTIAKYNQCPTQSPQYEGAFAWKNHALVMPDYYGFGVSMDRPQGYLDAENTAHNNIDAYIAGVQLLKDGDVTIPDKLYSFGYSQGGFNSMANLKYVTKHPELGITFDKVFCGGSPFDLDVTFQKYTNGNFNNSLAFVPMTIISINETHNLGRSYSSLFTEALAANYGDWILSKNYSTTEIDAKIKEAYGSDVTIPQILHPDLMDESSDTYNAIMSIAGDYSLTKGWTPPPGTYILIYHSENDDTVPYANLGAMADFLGNHPDDKKAVLHGKNGGHMDAVIFFVQKVLDKWNE